MKADLSEQEKSIILKNNVDEATLQMIANFPDTAEGLMQTRNHLYEMFV